MSNSIEPGDSPDLDLHEKKCSGGVTGLQIVKKILGPELGLEPRTTYTQSMYSTTELSGLPRLNLNEQN